jgi:hypothetical protein
MINSPKVLASVRNERLALVRLPVPRALSRAGGRYRGSGVTGLPDI